MVCLQMRSASAESSLSFNAVTVMVGLSPSSLPAQATLHVLFQPSCMASAHNRRYWYFRISANQDSRVLRFIVGKYDPKSDCIASSPLPVSSTFPAQTLSCFSYILANACPSKVNSVFDLKPVFGQLRSIFRRVSSSSQSPSSTWRSSYPRFGLRPRLLSSVLGAARGSLRRV